MEYTVKGGTGSLLITEISSRSIWESLALGTESVQWEGFFPLWGLRPPVSWGEKFSVWEGRTGVWGERTQIW